MNKAVNKTLFGTNGVRGIFEIDLTPETIIRLSKSPAHYFPPGSLAVGFDGRNSSPIISRIVCSALNSEGRDIQVVGLVPTPCLQYAIKYTDLSGGVMITASQKSPKNNRIKKEGSDGG